MDPPPLTGTTPMYEKYGLLIDNTWRPAASGKTIPVFSPATEDQIGEIPLAASEDVAAVLKSAARGFATWRAMPAWVLVTWW